MLSVLIPIYNFDVTQLVTDLSKQCSANISEFEILCIDDGSLAQFKSVNKPITKLKGVKYIELGSNLGRAKIREYLAEHAKYSKLLFLDCDVYIKGQNFIGKYLQHTESQVTIGGIIYYSTPPDDPSLMLRWKYGREREQRTASERKSSNFLQFLASNLLIDKNLFLSIPLQSELEGYGHEDTWLGLQLEKKNIDISHINNPVIHAGLDSAEEFLDKSMSGVKNLVKLYFKEPKCSELRLVNVFERLKRYSLLYVTFLFLEGRMKKIELNLKSSEPNLKMFDQWKLYHFIKIYKELS